MERKLSGKFADKMGFAKKAPRPANHGIVADWSKLPKTTKPFRQGWRYTSERIRAQAPGVGSIEWCYEKKVGDDTLSISIWVFGQGQQPAIKWMDTMANSTSMVESPYHPFSVPIGDFTAFVPWTKHATILWLFYNVLVEIESSDESFDAVPMAKSIQKFLEENVTAELTKHVPRIENVVVSPPKVKVGEKFKVEVNLPEGASPSNYLVKMRESWDKLGYVDPDSKDELAYTFVGKTAGQGIVSIMVINKKTLLSPVLEAPVEIQAK